ncbi:MAG TPA: restriction endonuclease [Candidatus Binatia bacterium]|jgi:HJR/Mrr/RecB family endonuclease
MTKVSSFTVGEIYTNDQIRFSLDVENLGGIRPALGPDRNVRHVAVLTAAEDSGRLRSENPYYDRIEGDVLTYTAQGREGDQELTGRNKRLIEQYTVPTPLFGFVNLGRQTYRFLGLLELLRHYQERQADKRGNIRRVWSFDFRIYGSPRVVPISEAKTLTAALLAQSRQNNPLVTLDREVASTPVVDLPSGIRSAGEIESVRMRLFQIAPLEFEHFVKLVMERSGFVEVAVTRASGDGGIDVNAYVENGNDFFAGTHVQAQVKRWRHAVGSPDINSFRGALSTTAKGVFVTTNAFTRAAVTEASHANKPSISLIDGPRLSAILLRLNLAPQ